MKFCVLLLFATIALASAVGPYNNRPKSNNYYGQHAQPTRVPAPSTYAKNSANGQEVQTLRNDNEIYADGSYHYAYETSNGISGSESGVGGVSVQGASSYTSPEGVEIKLSYTADETGYHPVGDHIPKTPDYVYKALEYIRTHPSPTKDYYTSEIKLPTTNIAPPAKKPVARKPVPATRKSVTRKPASVTRKNSAPAYKKPATGRIQQKAKTKKY